VSTVIVVPETTGGPRGCATVAAGILSRFSF
jgi:hypothetical protein